MVAVRLEDWVQIDTGNAETGKIREFFPDSFEISPEIIVRLIDARSAVRQIQGIVVPVFVNGNRTSGFAVRLDAPVKFRFVGTVEPVGEDLIGDAVPKPFGRLEIPVVNGNAVKVRRFAKVSFPGVAAVKKRASVAKCGTYGTVNVTVALEPICCIGRTRIPPRSLQ